MNEEHISYAVKLYDAYQQILFELSWFGTFKDSMQWDMEAEKRLKNIKGIIEEAGI